MVVLNILWISFAISASARLAIDKVITTDHRDASFGQNWGVLMKELRLLARPVFVVIRTT